jgi:CBS-domain-containing membrane protein
VTAGTSAGGRVADVMVTCVKTLRPGCGLGAIRAFFTDDHFHMALIVEEAGRLVTTIERPDLLAVASGSEPVAT